MKNNSDRLRAIQDWMQTVVMNPSGIEDGINSDSARRHIDVTSSNVESVVSRSKSLSSIDRLAVYGNAYVARLLECLADEFPAVAHAVGEETFASFAFEYVQLFPSRSYTLAQLGADFPRYLTETRPECQNAGEPDWAEFLIDLAILERTYSDVFDGPGIEHSTTLTHDDLARMTPDTWPNTKLEFAECVRLLSLRFPVHEYASAVRHNGEPIPAEPRPTWLVVTRREFVVRRFGVSLPEFELLTQLQAGSTVGEAIEHAAQHTEEDDETFARNLQEWFRTWTKCGLIISVKTPK